MHYLFNQGWIAGLHHGEGGNGRQFLHRIEGDATGRRLSRQQRRLLDIVLVNFGGE